MNKFFNIGFFIFLIGGSVRCNNIEYIICAIGGVFMIIAALAKKAGEDEIKRRYRHRSYIGNAIEFTDYGKHTRRSI